MKYNNFLTLSVSILIVIILSTVSCENNTEKNDLIVYNFKSLDGQKIDFANYKGKYSILSFSFTRCPSLCPMIHKELIKLRKEFNDEINIVSINVDPENDTPESLKKYMKDNNFDWDILIGDVNEIEKVMHIMLERPDRKLSSPHSHLPNLYLMNKNFDYIDKYFPESVEVGILIDKLNSLEL